MITTRDRARTLVEHRTTQRFIISLIVLNAVTLGLETSDRMLDNYGELLHTIDRIVLAIFVIELLVRLYGLGWRFFRDPWNVFDTLVVGVALVPAAGPLSVLRTLRVLRVLRLVSAVPSMRRVVAGLLRAVPGMASVASLLALVIFVAGVMATKLFDDIAPQYFGDLGTTLFTLFQTMTGEGWPEVARTVMAAAPLAWIFFVIYILVSSFAVLNLFIAVVVNGMEDQVTKDLADAEERNAATQAEANRIIIEEIRALRVEVAALRQPADLVTVSIYTSADDGEPVKAAVLAMLREYGIEVVQEHEPVFGSWFQRFRVRVRDAATSEGVRRRLHKIELALELQQLGKAQAEIDKSKSEAVALLLNSMHDQEEAAVRLGSLVIVKAAGSVAVWTISESEAAELDTNADLIEKPAQMLAYLRELKSRPPDQLRP